MKRMIFAAVATLGVSVGVLQPASADTSTSFILQFTESSSACTSPQSPNHFYVVVGQNDVTGASAKNILAVAMLAMSQGKNVGVLFDNSAGNCYVKSIYVDD